MKTLYITIMIITCKEDPLPSLPSFHMFLPLWLLDSQPLITTPSCTPFGKPLHGITHISLFSSLFPTLSDLYYIDQLVLFLLAYFPLSRIDFFCLFSLWGGQFLKSCTALFSGSHITSICGD